MKKSMILAMVMMIVIASCESGITQEGARSEKTAKVHVNFSGFEIETTTRTTSADDAGVNHISFAVINSEGQIVKSAKQAKGSDGFGSVSFELAEGTYIFAAEADNGAGVATIGVSNGEVIATIPGSTVYDTFAKSQHVTVTAGEDVNLQMTLSRISAQLYLATKDNQPEEVKKLQFLIGDTTKAAYSSFCINLATGTMDGFGTTGHLKREWSRTSMDTCKATTQSCALLLDTEEKKLPVTIVVRGADNSVLYSHSIDSVPFKQNCKTTITGNLYGSEEDCKSTFEFDTAWKDSIDGGW